MNVTIRKYYVSFKNLYGLFVLLPLVIPVIRFLVPDFSTAAQVLFPPLGSIQKLACAATFALVLLSTYVALVCFRQQKTPSRRAHLLMITGAVVSMIALISLYVPFVWCINVPSKKIVVPLSIGYELTDFARQTYPQWSKTEMLEESPTEDQVQQLWTVQSICVIRVLLWFSHLSMLICFNSIWCSAAYQLAYEEQSMKSESSASKPA